MADAIACSILTPSPKKLKSLNQRALVQQTALACLSLQRPQPLFLLSDVAALLEPVKGATRRAERVVHKPRVQATRKLRALPEDLQRFIAGGFAGAVSKIVTAPIEDVRIQLMAGKGTALEVVQTTFKKHGLLGFFSGALADVVRVIPSRGAELASFDLYKRVLRGALSQRDPRTNELAPAGPLVTGIAGGLAGVTSTVATFPLEVVRTRSAVDPIKYKGLINSVRKVASEEGFGALYKGLDASLVGVVPYAALRLGLYDGLKWGYRKVKHEKTIPPQASMVLGAVAGMCAATVTFPLEVVRRQAMAGKAPSGNVFRAMVLLAQRDGISSLYRGLLLTWLKQAPQNAVSFASYDAAKNFLGMDA